MTHEHWNYLYDRLYETHEECKRVDDQTYKLMIGMILRHMLDNKPYLNLK